MAEVEFLDIKIGDGLRLNGYSMGLLAVGNLQVADHQRVEIVILQKLEDEPSPSPRAYLVELLGESGFAPGVAKNITAVAIGRDTFKTTDDLTDDEVLLSIGAIEAAIADDNQLNEGDNNENN